MGVVLACWIHQHKEGVCHKCLSSEYVQVRVSLFESDSDDEKYETKIETFPLGHNCG